MSIKHFSRPFIIFIAISLLLSACASNLTTTQKPESGNPPEFTVTITLQTASIPAGTTTQEPHPSATPNHLPTSTPEPTATPDVRLDPKDWQTWPVIPTLSTHARTIYASGLQAGNLPNRFSKVGDCQNITTYFLAIFDNPSLYRLGPDYEYLAEAIHHFSGCFSRESIATAGGMNVASVLSRHWGDKDSCLSNESPLSCELRLNKPSIVLISMEETWGRENKVENYEKYMRQIIETVIEFGAVPILATKADNKEGDHLINQTVARLAYEYDIPLWNFWLAVQPLPDHGLLEDGFHLTHGLNYYDEPKNLKQAWPVRNLTALQVLDSVWRQLNDMPLIDN